jgi:hypothetical protein
MSDNCQNCSSKDKVTIAGKSFCANCGTADATTTSAPTSTQVPDPPAVPARPAGSITDSAMSSNAANNDLVASLTNSLSGNSTSDQPAGQLSQPQSVATIESTTIPTPATTTDASPANVPTPPVTNSTNIRKFSGNISAVTSQPNDVLDLSPTKPIAPNNINTGNSVSDISKPTNKPENIGSELPTLDGKDEHVFSDAQFHALTQDTNDRPVDIAKLSQKPNPQTLQPASNPSTVATQPVSQASPTSVQSMDIKKPSMPPGPAQVMPTIATTPSTPNVSPTPVPPQQPAIATVVDQTTTDTSLASTVKPNTLTKKGAKVGTVAMTAVGLLLLGAYVWQVNYPNLALKVASGKAGINASVPNYLPSGWQISGNISSSPGIVSYQLSSGDGKKATVNESKTDWDSQALAENYITNQSDKYTALQADGLTIYVYGNQASWINKGTWYRIEGANTGLSQDQLIRMATSL